MPLKIDGLQNGGICGPVPKLTFHMCSSLQHTRHYEVYTHAQNHRIPDASGNGPVRLLTSAEEKLVEVYGFKWPHDREEMLYFLHALYVRRYVMRPYLSLWILINFNLIMYNLIATIRICKISVMRMPWFFFFISYMPLLLCYSFMCKIQLWFGCDFSNQYLGVNWAICLLPIYVAAYITYVTHWSGFSS